MTNEHNSHPCGSDRPGGTAVESSIRQIVERIVGQVHPLRIILFGSRARNEGGRESDVDLLVVVSEGTHRRETAHMLYRGLRGLPVPVDVLVVTERDLERHKDNPGLIYRTILREGKELYAA